MGRRRRRRKYTTRTTTTPVASLSNFGGFRMGEIDEKSFLIFTFLTQPQNLSFSSFSSETTTVSGGDNDLHQPLFMCPNLRSKAETLKRKQNGGNSDARARVLLSISPHFLPKGSGDQHVQYLLDYDPNDDYGSDRETNICKQPVVPLYWCNNQESVMSAYRCDVCGDSDERGTDYYFCVTCDDKFHRECVESPCEIQYPSHPFHSFQLSYYKEDDWECGCCKAPVNSAGYHSPTSRFGLHPVCAMKPIPMVLDSPKRHPHPLTFFPKQAHLPCHICGLIKENITTYLCVPCVSLVHQFVVHEDCADSPTAIKISRHPHRISFTSSLPPGEWSCGVCRKKVDNNYGAYSCSKCDGYFVHTRCALRRDLWDGEELEGIPEEPEIVVPPFERIADGIILHFSHAHYLKVEVYRVYDKDKFCQACALPIYEGNYCLCMEQCDFILHEACANAPRRKHNPLHAHPLTLKVVTNQYQFDYDQGYFSCDACHRRSCGFVYESGQGIRAFRLDLRCALVSEPFEYQGHEHPLFLALTPEEEKSAQCHICQRPIKYIRKLNCIECDFVICFECATLPYKVRYKHDKHLLIFQKEAREESGWCEICEKKIVYSRKEEFYSKKGGFYSCDHYCGTTLHVDCLLGINPYMRPGQTIMISGKVGEIVRNNTMSRPFCLYRFCDKGRCPYGVVFKNDNNTYCSFFCLYLS